MNKKRLYEKIMTSVSKEVKRVLNELSYNLSIDDNDFEDDIDIRHEDDKDFKGDKVRYNIIMRDFIKERKSFFNMSRKDHRYIVSLYDKYGVQYKVEDRKELDIIITAFSAADVHLNWLDVSNITDMSDLFAYKNHFNSDISRWDVSNVTNMSRMFENAIRFNLPIGDWDVSNVTNMGNMFDGALKFNQPIGDWDVSNVIDMHSMFAYTVSFNQPIGDWDVSNVKYMNAMFTMSHYNQPLENWNISNVTDMGDMFYLATFRLPISNWDVSNKFVENMFRGGLIPSEFKPKLLLNKK